MRSLVRKSVAAWAVTVVCLGAGMTLKRPRRAQVAPAAAGPAVAAPTYVSIPLEITVDRPAAEVWKRIGKYCDIGEWLQIPCTITSGTDGEFGAVRSVANEVLVGKTELSYTYTQPVRNNRPYNLVSRHPRGETAHGEDVEDRLHHLLRQFDAGRRRRTRGG